MMNLTMLSTFALALFSLSASAENRWPGNERIERAYITNNGTATIASQSGSWISSVSRSAAGVVDITIANGQFNAAPTCVATRAPSTQASSEQGIIANSATSVTVISGNSSGGNQDLDFTILCMGPF